MKRAIFLSTFGILALILTGCDNSTRKPVVSAVQGSPAADSDFYAIERSASVNEVFNDKPDLLIDSIMASMTLEEKVGQMVFPEIFPKPNSVESIKNIHLKRIAPGGFVLFGGGMVETGKVIRGLQEASKIPLLFAEDFERGLSMRIEEGKSYPWNMGLGAVDKHELIYQMGINVAHDAKILGVQWNLSPVADVNNNSKNPIINVRSFGEDPESVGKLAVMMSMGLQYGGVLSSLKHFPGHGNTNLDTHSDKVIINSTKEEFLSTEVLPFKKAINEGAYTVMVGHLGVKAYNTPDTPATLSHTIVTKLLREELGFKGIINTDALSMKAITKYFNAGKAAVLAVKAGIDVLMAPESAYIAVNAIVNAVKKGEIPEERINASVRRILQAKKWTGVLTKAPEPISAVEKLVKEKKIDEVSKDLSIRSITLVKTDDSVFPLDKNKKYLHLVFTDGNKYPYSTDFNQELKKRNGKIETILMPVNPGSVQRNLIDGKLKNCDGIIISVYTLFKQSSGKISLSQTAINFINGLKSKNKKVIMLAHSNPYVLSDSPWVDVFLTNYGAVLSSEVALAEALFGENNITGTLPVSIPGTDFKRGMGINLFESKKKTLNYKDKTDQIDNLILHGIQDSVFPGAAISIIKDDTVFYQKAYGNYTYNSGSPEIELTSLFDLASLTKVTATLFATMKLYEEGRLDLNAPVEKYLPEFVNKKSVTIKSLLLHESGLPAFKFYYKMGLRGEEIIRDIEKSPLQYKTGTKTVYSDLGIIILGVIIEKITGQPLEKYLKENLWEPAGMNMTMFNPPIEKRQFCVPTEIDNYWRYRLIQGTVHDETAALLGGVAGHAGLFSTVGDISKYMMMILGDGTYNGVQFLKPGTIALFIKRASNKSSRALGWDTNFEHKGVGDKGFPEYSFGHTGFTGTSIWADPVKKFAVIFFTNRVHPDRGHTGIIKFRPRLHDAIASLLL